MKTKTFFLATVLIISLTGLSLAQIAGSPSSNKISLDIKGMDIVDVLKMLATRANMNIVVGKNVTGKVVLFLKDVDAWDAFELILSANDLAYDKRGNIINIMTQRDYELQYGERYQDKKQAKLIQLKYAKGADLARALTQIKSNLGKVIADEGSNTLALIDNPQKIKDMLEFIGSTDLPVQTRIFTLNYAQADKLSAKVQEAITKGVGSVRIDERTNKLAVTDYPQKLEEIAKVISAFDEKTPQVLIDAQIIEIKPSDKFELGVDWDYWIKNHFRITSNLPIGTTGRLLLGTNNNTPAARGQYKAILDLLRTIGDTKVLSSPRITALNNQEAKILVGTKDAYITSTISQGGSGTSVTSQSVNFVDVGIKLYVTPTINQDNFVTMKIRPEISSATRTDITSQGQITQIPIVSTSETETTVMIKDGVTIMIGGLQKDERTKTVKKTPVLGDIPLIGFVFRSTSEEVKKTELVILLTPHIMSGESSYSDIFGIKPVEGTVAKMESGNIIREDVPSAETILGSFSYYQVVTNKIKRFAKLNPPPDKKGEVELNFTLSSRGNLIREPQVVKATDPALVPYALKAVKEASSFPAFPKELAQAEESFNVTIDYRQ